MGNLVLIVSSKEQIDMSEHLQSKTHRLSPTTSVYRIIFLDLNNNAYRSIRLEVRDIGATARMTVTQNSQSHN